MKRKRRKGTATPEIELLAARIVERWRALRLPLTIERIASEFSDVSRYDIVAALRALENAGRGTLNPIRAGQKSKFEWSDVERKTESPDPTAARLPDAASHDTPREPRGVGAVLEHHFYLRAGFIVEMTLPADLTGTEVERLCTFLQALPFEQEPSH